MSAQLVDRRRIRGPRPRRPAMERWAALVDRTAANGCWQWTGSTDAKGYGRFASKGRQRGSVVIVHRWTYEQLVGPIPAGLTIDHVCGNTSCVNPKHLEPVTRSENNRRAAAKRLKAAS